MTRIVVGILGLGRMGRLHARVFGELDARFEVRGFADPAPLADTAGVACSRFGSPDALIDAVDLLVVAAPAMAHAPLARKALRKGRAVLVEKPLAPTHAEATAIMDEAALGRLFVGHSERFNPVVRALYANVCPHSIETLHVDRVVLPHASSLLPTDDVLLNLGVHDLDLVEHLTRARADILSAEGDRASSTVTLAAGDASASVRCARQGDATRRIVLTTADAVFEGNLLTRRLVRKDKRSGRESAIAVSDVEPLRAQAESLYRVLAGRERSPEIASGAHGLRAVELAEHAMRLREASAFAQRRLASG